MELDCRVTIRTISRMAVATRYEDVGIVLLVVSSSDWELLRH
jgi:hypothetical protein